MSKETKKVIGYLRVASSEQADKNSSLDRQKQLITKYAAQEGYEIVKWFENRSSGRLTYPVGYLDNVLDYFKANPQVKKLIVTTADRISRSIDGFYFWKAAFKHIGVTIKFVDEDNSIVAYTPIWQSLKQPLNEMATLEPEKRQAFYNRLKAKFNQDTKPNKKA